MMGGNTAVRERLRPSDVSTQYARGRRVFAGADFSGMSFFGFRFEGIDITGANFTNARISSLPLETMSGVHTAIFEATEVTREQAAFIVAERRRRNGIATPRTLFSKMFAIKEAPIEAAKRA